MLTLQSLEPASDSVSPSLSAPPSHFVSLKNKQTIKIKKKKDVVIERGTWLAQLVEHVTLDLGVVSLSPTLSVEIT